MISRVLRRLLLGVVTVAVVYTVTFVMVVTIPGNPLQQGQRNISPEMEQALRLRYRMDNNWLYFGELVRDSLRLDFGPTFMYPDWTCGQVLAESLPVSFSLGLGAIMLAMMIGIPAGVASAIFRGGWMDAITMSLVLVGISVPSFIIGTLLLIVFSVKWQLAPVGGWGSLGHMVLPTITLSLPFLAYITRLTRTSMMDVLSQDFIRTALAKGASPTRVICEHALPVALLPVLSYLGPALAQAMTGSFVVEKVFALPGLGQHFVNAALNRDAGLLLAIVLIFSILIVAMNLLVDLLQVALDPRSGEAV